MSEEINPNEKVITKALTYQRITYPKFTPLKTLPDELQKSAKDRKLVETYSKVYKPVEKNINFKKENVILQRKIESLTGTIQDLNKENAALKKQIKTQKDK